MGGTSRLLYGHVLFGIYLSEGPRQRFMRREKKLCRRPVRTNRSIGRSCKVEPKSGGCLRLGVRKTTAATARSALGEGASADFRSVVTAKARGR